MTQKRVSVAIMARNEALALDSVISRLLITGFQPHDIVLMDDCSSDHTLRVAKERGVRFVTFPQQIGLSKLIRCSLQDSLDQGFDYHITMDGDGQHAPEYAPAIADALEAGADMVVNTRYGLDSVCTVAPPFDRLLLNIQTTVAVNRITGLNLTDPLCGLRGYRREVMEFLLMQSFVTDVGPDPHGFVLESLLRVWHANRFRIVELPHPAIYNGDGKISTLYQEEFLEQRLERFTMHARHLVRVTQALNLPLRHVLS